MSLASLLLFGLLLGMQHATEADHLAAVATLATRTEGALGATVRQGVAWGIGHTLALAAFGGAVLLLGRAVPPGVERSLEAVVGAMLVLLGADVLRRLRRERAAAPQGGTEGKPRAPAGALRALAVGTVHGLAGTAALVVLSLQSAPTFGRGLAYIALFGLGSIVGMALLSAAVALPLSLGARALGRVHTGVSGLIGLVSCALGLAMLGVRLAA